MLGYRVNKETLNALDFPAANSSVRALFSRLSDEGMTGEELLAGKSSLGALWEEAGYKAVPSPRQPNPGKRTSFDLVCSTYLMHILISEFI